VVEKPLVYWQLLEPVVAVGVITPMAAEVAEPVVELKRLII
jgi:hypothetical protein